MCVISRLVSVLMWSRHQEVQAPVLQVRTLNDSLLLLLWRMKTYYVCVCVCVALLDLLLVCFDCFYCVKIFLLYFFCMKRSLLIKSDWYEADILCPMDGTMEMFLSSGIHVTQNTTVPPSGEFVSNTHHTWQWLLQWRSIKIERTAKSTRYDVGERFW